MSVSVALIPADQQQHREALGRAVSVWMRKNSWSQQTFHDWAKAAGTEGPWNSQISLLQRGRHDPKALFWAGMAAFNAAVAEQSFPPELNRGTRDRLVGSQPFLMDDGRPAKATDFFGMFVGEIPIPEAYGASSLPTYSEEDAVGITEMCRDAFRRIATDKMLTPKEAWDDLKPHCQGMTGTEITKFREVLAGWSAWNAAEVNALSVPDALGKPAQALERWGDIPLATSVRNA